MASRKLSRLAKFATTAPETGLPATVRATLVVVIVKGMSRPAGVLAVPPRASRTVPAPRSQVKLSRPASAPSPKRAVERPPSLDQRQSPGVWGASCQFAGGVGVASGGGIG